MRIGILSRNRNLYSTRRLAQAARLRGHDVSIIDTMTVAVEIGTAASPERIKTVLSAPIPRTRYLPLVDGIVPRIGASITPYGLAVVRHLTAQGVRTTASAEGIAHSRDKLHSLQLMAKAGLPIPKTAVIAHKDGLFAAVQAVDGLPVVVKTVRGTHGEYVTLAYTMQQAVNAIQRLYRLGRQVLLQEFIAEAEGRDVRVIVVGRECVAAMERRAATGEFRANLHRGGTAVSLPLSDDLCQLARRAAQAHGLSVAGVDLIQSERGPLLLEVNSSPGLQGIEKATTVDVAAAIIRYLELSDKQEAPRRGRRRRKKGKR